MSAERDREDYRRMATLFALAGLAASNGDSLVDYEFTPNALSDGPGRRRRDTVRAARQMAEEAVRQEFEVSDDQIGVPVSSDPNGTPEQRAELLRKLFPKSGRPVPREELRAVLGWPTGWLSSALRRLVDAGVLQTVGEASSGRMAVYRWVGK